MNKLLISCPTCEMRGIKNNLAQILSDGRVIVRRFEDNDTTVIYGNNLTISCGLCGQLAFRREEKSGTLLYKRITWALGIEPQGTVGTVGA